MALVFHATKNQSFEAAFKKARLNSLNMACSWAVAAGIDDESVPMIPAVAWVAAAGDRGLEVNKAPSD